MDEALEIVSAGFERLEQRQFAATLNDYKIRVITLAAYAVFRFAIAANFLFAYRDLQRRK